MISGLLRRATVLVGFSVGLAAGIAQQPIHPLRPPDRSSPRATLKTFLDSSDAAAAYFAREYRPSPTHQSFKRLLSLFETPMQCLDLSGLPPASRTKAGGAAAMALYEVLSRVELPPLDQVPGPDPAAHSGATNQLRWAIPNTEIVLVRMAGGARVGDFLFSAETVARAVDFYKQTRDLPYVRQVPIPGLYERRITGGGWLIPATWVESMPEWMRGSLGGQAAWKWLALGFVLGFFGVLLRVAHRWSLKGGGGRPFLQALARLLLPLFILVATPLAAYLALVQINFINEIGSAIQLISASVIALSAAWLSWRVAPVLAEALIASPSIAPESIDAHLIRICSRLMGLIAAAALLAIGADRVGVPVFGILAGLGVGGLAIALAAQPTIENLIGSLNLFADKPIRVGDFCRYGDSLGTVEAIGIRSTRIRGIDRTVTTIPNAMLSKMPIVNFTQRDRMLLRVTFGVRCETSAEQLRFLLAKLREMLVAHAKIIPESARVRLVGFAGGSREIEVFAHARTKDWAEFLGIQEDLFLRLIDVVQQSGTRFTIPSQTLYFGRDNGLDPAQVKTAEAQVRRWREENRLPFPDFAPEQVEAIRGTLAYPPAGSAQEHSLSKVDAFKTPAEDMAPKREGGAEPETSAAGEINRHSRC